MVRSVPQDSHVVGSTYMKPMAKGRKIVRHRPRFLVLGAAIQFDEPVWVKGRCVGVVLFVHVRKISGDADTRPGREV